jgi:hypothetical protein
MQFEHLSILKAVFVNIPADSMNRVIKVKKKLPVVM